MIFHVYDFNSMKKITIRTVFIIAPIIYIFDYIEHEILVLLLSKKNRKEVKNIEEM